jgi:hypothetical protein
MRLERLFKKAVINNNVDRQQQQQQKQANKPQNIYKKCDSKLILIRTEKN